jgi:hypothetical protein
VGTVAFASNEANVMSDTAKGFDKLAQLLTGKTADDAAQPAGPTQAVETKPETPAEPATVEPATPVAAEPETATSEPVTAAAPVTTKAGTTKGDRGEPPKAKGNAKQAKAERDARLGKGKGGKGNAKQGKANAPAPEPAAPVEPVPVQVVVQPADTVDMTNVLGYDLTRWPDEPGLPPLNPVWRHQKTDDDGKPVFAESVVDGVTVKIPVMIDTVLSMIDFIKVAHASHVMTRPVTKQALALACYMRPDAHKYSLDVWAYVLRVVFDPHNSVLDPKRNIITRATQQPKALFVAIVGSAGNRKTYRLRLTALGLSTVTKALVAENAQYKLPVYFSAAA